jgi:hypothetical protein
MMVVVTFMDVFVIDFFDWCVETLENIGDYTGWGYELANIIIFVIVQPSLILLFFCLWICAKLKNGKISRPKYRECRQHRTRRY